MLFAESSGRLRVAVTCTRRQCLPAWAGGDADCLVSPMVDSEKPLFVTSYQRAA